MKNPLKKNVVFDPCAALFSIVAELMNFGETISGRKEREIIKTLFHRQKMALFSIEIGTRDHPEGIPLSTIAQSMNIPLTSASQLVASLVKKELCQRNINPNNHRTVQITLTDSGRKLTKKIVARTTEKLRELQEGLSEKEIATFEKVAIHCYQRKNLIFKDKQK